MLESMSSFWNWFIVVPTVLSFVALFIFLGAYSSGKSTPDGTKETTGHVWDEDLEEFNNPLPKWWLNLFYITLVFGIVYLLLYPGLGSFKGLLGWSQTTQYSEEIADADSAYGPLFEQFLQKDIKTVAADPKARAIGKRLFATYCTSCHGSDAAGSRGYPNLRDGDWLYGGEPEAIETSIAKGRMGYMPPWNATLSPEEIQNLTDYILSFRKGTQQNPANVAKGQTLFTTNCAGCHQADAHGNKALGAPNLTDEVWLHGSSRDRITETIIQGRQNQMPAHEQFLGKAKVHLLAAYVYGLSSTPSTTAKAQ